MTDITIARPDDWHVHLRDGAALARTVPDTARVMGRAIVMPNLKPPVTTTAQAAAYRDRILANVPAGSGFEPLMTLYLTDRTTEDEVRRASESGFVVAFKLYPAGATTNSDAGVTDIAALDPILDAMARHGVKLLVHGEVTDDHVDVFDREAEFIERTLVGIVERHPGLSLVLEHITTQNAVEFVKGAPPNVGATITPQHLLFNRNHMLVGGIRPHFFCLPILKRSTHQEALLEAATSGSPKFFLGTDSAPHPTGAKESACGCAGCYSAHAALELYATAFESVGALDRLEGFASHHGADFYGLPRHTDTVALERASWVVPESMAFGEDTVTPLMAGASLDWRLRDV